MFLGLLGKPERARARVRHAWQPGWRFLASLPRRRLQLAVELLQLPPAFLARALQVHLRLRVAGPGVVGRQLRPHVQRTLLVHLQLLLAQSLVELQLLCRLALPVVRRRILYAALMLLHSQLQLVLLVLALELVLLQRAHAGVVRGMRSARGRQEQRNRR